MATNKTSKKSSKKGATSLISGGRSWFNNTNKLLLFAFVALFAVAGGMYGASRSFAATYPYISYCDNSTWSYGESGGCVKTIQAIMRYSIDYSVGPTINCSGLDRPIDIDGSFGPQTKAYVKCFQASKTIWVGNGTYLSAITADGIVGPQTWSKIRSMVYYWRYYPGYNLKGIY